jgi:23S rRNA (adenine2503-C2)-methyltransferase
MNSVRTNLLGFTRDELTTFVEDIGEPRYRGKQIFAWLYEKGATNFSSMTDLGKSFRSRLELAATIDGLSAVSQQRSRHDGTTKFLFALPDGLRVETVLIPPASAFAGVEAAGEDEQKRLTLCVSTQVGCPLDCAFCATATMGYRRNLTSGEIVDQILQVRRLTGKRITNVVFMGMGEPMMNYDNVMRAVEIIIDGIGIAARHVTISTAGWAEKIRQMADEDRGVKLAVSLHSAVEETRTKLMPITRRFGLGALTEALEYYYSRQKQQVTFEYIFFDNVNDTPPEVARLIQLARRIPSKLNIIPFHSIDFVAPTGIAAILRPSKRMKEIVEHLRRSGLTVMIRSSAGEDIDAACGQLAVECEQTRRTRISPRTGENLSASRRKHPSSSSLS